jgi:hypothetical protein
MRKISGWLTLILAMVLIPGLSQAERIIGPTHYTWVADSGHGEDGGKMSYSVEYSSCRAVTDVPNDVVISIKFIYTDWGRQVLQRPNVAYEVETKFVNLVTGATKTYHAELFYLSGGSSTTTNVANFDQWVYPRQGSAGEHYVDLARQIPNCTEN